MSRIIIGFVDTNPDTGEEYPFVKMCECEHEWAVTWIVSVLKRDLGENADQPNREIKIKTNENT
jgi:hypothetical protein